MPASRTTDRDGAPVFTVFAPRRSDACARRPPPRRTRARHAAARHTPRPPARRCAVLRWRLRRPASGRSAPPADHAAAGGFESAPTGLADGGARSSAHTTACAATLRALSFAERQARAAQPISASRRPAPASRSASARSSDGDLISPLRACKQIPTNRMQPGEIADRPRPMCGPCHLGDPLQRKRVLTDGVELDRRVHAHLKGCAVLGLTSRAACRTTARFSLLARNRRCRLQSAHTPQVYGRACLTKPRRRRHSLLRPGRPPAGLPPVVGGIRAARSMHALLRELDGCRPVGDGRPRVSTTKREQSRPTSTLPGSHRGRRGRRGRAVPGHSRRRKPLCFFQVVGQTHDALLGGDVGSGQAETVQLPASSSRPIAARIWPPTFASRAVRRNTGTLSVPTDTKGLRSIPRRHQKPGSSRYNSAEMGIVAKATGLAKSPAPAVSSVS